MLAIVSIAFVSVIVVTDSFGICIKHRRPPPSPLTTVPTLVQTRYSRSSTVIDPLRFPLVPRIHSNENATEILEFLLVRIATRERVTTGILRTRRNRARKAFHVGHRFLRHLESGWQSPVLATILPRNDYSRLNVTDRCWLPSPSTVSLESMQN